MKYFISFFLIFVFSCETKLQYPEGGFDYPKKIANADTNLYYYQLKDIEPKKEAFYDSYNYTFYQMFDEPNLSIKPQQQEIFRLTYAQAFGNSVIITLTKNFIIVKKGNPSQLYDEDTSRLSSIENFHLRFLRRRFPIDTVGKNVYQKRYLDSILKLYPQLLNPNYYRKLLDKVTIRSNEKFIYPTIKIALTPEEYNSLIKEINTSGFWSMPYKVECQDPPMDDDGFTLEANTKTKYKIVKVDGCPDDTTKFARACQKIIDIAKMKKEINLIWSGKTVAIDSVEFPDIKRK